MSLRVLPTTLVALTITMALTACQTASRGGRGLGLTVPYGGSHGHPPGQGRDGVASFRALESKLAVYREERAVLAAAATARLDVAQCEEMYALMHSICEVKERLCGLANKHARTPSYQSLCEEARVECVAAQTSCEACSQPEP